MKGSQRAKEIVENDLMKLSYQPRVLKIGTEGRASDGVLAYLTKGEIRDVVVENFARYWRPTQKSEMVRGISL